MTIVKLVPKAENWSSRKEECKHGHPFTPENTYIYDRGWKIERVCKTCVLARQAAARRRRLAGGYDD